MKILGVCLVLAAFSLTACSADSPRNPSFALTVNDAQAVLSQMRDTPKALKRPVVVLAGFLDPGILSSQLAGRIRRLTGDERVLSVGFAFCGDFDDCRERLIDRVQNEYPSDDPAWTTEVDVVAISMGGLVARYAAAAPDSDANPQRRLRIAHLFTIGTPHQGAALAPLPTLDRCQIDMRAGSRFLQHLNSDLQHEGFPILAYVRLGDIIVGPANAAPPGRTAWWVQNKPLELAHGMACGDPRIVADIARRLRGEAPFATDPPAPLPQVTPISQSRRKNPAAIMWKPAMVLRPAAAAILQ